MDPGSAEQREGRCTASGTREEIALRGRVVICPSLSQFADIIKADVALWAKVVKDAGITAD
jgi:hypothetical protein